VSVNTTVLQLTPDMEVCAWGQGVRQLDRRGPVRRLPPLTTCLLPGPSAPAPLPSSFLPLSQSAYASVSSVTSGLGDFFAASPTPTDVAAGLSNTTASGLALPAGTPAVASGLATQAAALDGSRFAWATPGSDAAALKAWVASTKAAITSAVGAFSAARAARDTYFTTPSDANYNSMVAAANAYRGAGATTALRGQWDLQDSAPSAASSYKTAAAGIAASASAASALGPFAASATAAVGAAPALGGYIAAVGAITLPPVTVRAAARGQGQHLWCLLILYATGKRPQPPFSPVPAALTPATHLPPLSYPHAPAPRCLTCRSLRLTPSTPPPTRRATPLRRRSRARSAASQAQLACCRAASWASWRASRRVGRGGRAEQGRRGLPTPGVPGFAPPPQHLPPAAQTSKHPPADRPRRPSGVHQAARPQV
jgi:hypothetical protein